VSDANSRPAPDILDQATGALRGAPVPAGPPADLTAATVAAVNNRLTGVTPGEPTRQSRRRKIMRYIGYGTATAAAVGIATLAGVLWLGGGSAAAKLQKALDNAEKAGSVRIVFKSGPKGAEQTDVTIYRQGDFARVEDRDGKFRIVDLKGRKRLELDPVAKTARLIDLTAEEADAAADVYAKYANPLKTVRGAAGAVVKELPDERAGDRVLKVYSVRRGPPGHPGPAVGRCEDHPAGPDHRRCGPAGGRPDGHRVRSVERGVRREDVRVEGSGGLPGSEGVTPRRHAATTAVGPAPGPMASSHFSPHLICHPPP
jgi:hypothetical protein